MVLGDDCFIAGFSFSSPRAPLLVLEEGAGLTRSPWDFSLFCLKSHPNWTILVHSVVASRSRGLAQQVAVQSGKGKVAFLSPALYGMAYHSTHVSEPWSPSVKGAMKRSISCRSLRDSQGQLLFLGQG